MRRIFQFVAVGTALGIVLSVVFLAAPWFPARASQQSKRDYPLFIAITYVSFVIFAIVIVAMGYSLWKFRQKGPSDLRDGAPTHGNTLLEIAWTAIPVIIVVFFAVWGAKVLDDNEAHASNGRSVTVIAFSFAFEYRYDSDGGFIRNDGLYLPVDETTTLHMITPLYTPGTHTEEVIHGFWVPQWGIKQDATPGVHGKSVATTYVTPTQTGTFEVQCTELCGSGHGEMHFKNIHVLSQAAFAKWLAGAKADAAKAKAQAAANPGLAVFNNNGCGGCHTLAAAKSTGKVGPSLNDITTNFNRAKSEGKTKATNLAGFVKESIVDPNAYIAQGFAPGIMPQTFGTSLSSTQLNDLVAFVAKGGSG